MSTMAAPRVVAGFAGPAWQPRQVRFLRYVAGAVSKLPARAVLAVVKSIFLQPTCEAAWDALNQCDHRIGPMLSQVGDRVLRS
jgi:hypothetical protein